MRPALPAPESKLDIFLGHAKARRLAFFRARSASRAQASCRAKLRDCGFVGRTKHRNATTSSLLPCRLMLTRRTTDGGSLRVHPAEHVSQRSLLSQRRVLLTRRVASPAQSSSLGCGRSRARAWRSCWGRCEREHGISKHDTQHCCDRKNVLKIGYSCGARPRAAWSPCAALGAPRRARFAHHTRLRSRPHVPRPTAAPSPPKRHQAARSGVLTARRCRGPLPCRRASAARRWL